jgi:hypothetical protein
MSIGYWKNNKAHGKGYMISTTGEKRLYEGKDGLWVGPVTVVQMDGTEEIQEY